MLYVSCTPMAMKSNPDLLGQLYAKVEERTPLDREDIRVRIRHTCITDICDNPHFFSLFMLSWDVCQLYIHGNDFLIILAQQKISFFFFNFHISIHVYAYAHVFYTHTCIQDSEFVIITRCHGHTTDVHPYTAPTNSEKKNIVTDICYNYGIQGYTVTLLSSLSRDVHSSTLYIVSLVGHD